MPGTRKYKNYSDQRLKEALEKWKKVTKDVFSNKILYCYDVVNYPRKCSTNSLFQCLGGHEFDEGISELAPFIRHLDSPVLLSNVRLANNPELARLSNIRASVVIDVSGTDVGIIGYLAPETKNTKTSAQNIEFIDEIQSLKKEVSKLKQLGIKIIIALGHSGYIRDQEIAKKVDGLSLVVGGHSHTFLWNGPAPDIEKPDGPYPTEVTQASGRKVPVVHAFAFTKYLGKMHMTFDSRGNIISTKGAPMLLNNKIPRDSDVAILENHYILEFANISKEVIGNTTVVLDHTKCYIEECNVGNFVTDSMVYHYAKYYKGEYWTDAPIAVLVAGSFRNSFGLSTDAIPIPITKLDLLRLLPFSNNILLVDMNAIVLKKMLEHAVYVYGMESIKYRSFLQVSGLKVVYNVKKPPGSRIVDVYARCGFCAVPTPRKVSDTQVLKVLMTDYMYNGGGGYTMLKGLPMKKMQYGERVCMETLLANRSPIRPEIEGRIKIQQ